MDDQAQQNPSPPIVGDNQQTVSPQVPAQAGTTPVGTVQKEQAPPVGMQETPYIQPSEAEPVLSKEVSEAGVEPVSEMPKLTIEDKRAGLEPAKEAVPVQTEPTGVIQLPMTAQQARSILKVHKKVTDSFRWLALLILRQIKIARRGGNK